MVSDLARGRPDEEAIRACLAAAAVARAAGVSPHEASDAYYTTLLRSAGCTASSVEYAAAFGGDDVTVRGRGDMTDAADPGAVAGLLRAVSAGRGPAARA